MEFTWSQIERRIDELATKIQQGGAEFDAAVGVLRGGVVPARLLVARLALNDMSALNVRKHGDERRVTTDIQEDLSGKRLLLVEDILESGRSLQVAADYLTREKHAKVATAALYFTPQSEIAPDYSLGPVTVVPRMPWE